MSEILQKLTILIVEDENEIRKLMEEVMKSVFFEVYSAKNGDEGIKKFKKFAPDLIVTDIAMPIMDGLDMAKRINEISPTTPIIALSAFSDKEKLLKAIEVGVDKYILKPVDMDELLLAIENIARSKFKNMNIIKITDDLQYNPASKQLLCNDEEILLTKKEFSFIALLINKIGNLVLLDEIKKNVWSDENVNDTAIRTFVKRVRDKIGQDVIKNIPGLGYKIEVK
ncbi:MAG: response regulator transcription factor [Campylobacter sp.]